MTNLVILLTDFTFCHLDWWLDHKCIRQLLHPGKETNIIGTFPRKSIEPKHLWSSHQSRWQKLKSVSKIIVFVTQSLHLLCGFLLFDLFLFSNNSCMGYSIKLAQSIQFSPLVQEVVSSSPINVDALVKIECASEVLLDKKLYISNCLI